MRRILTRPEGRVRLVVESVLRRDELRGGDRSPPADAIMVYRDDERTRLLVLETRDCPKDGLAFGEFGVCEQHDQRK